MDEGRSRLRFREQRYALIILLGPTAFLRIETS